MRSFSTLYLASSNPGKLREFQDAASRAAITLELLPELSNLPICVEDGETFEQNARKKASHYAALTHRLVLAEDSGLVVDALGGRPGVYSARFSGLGATDESNNRKLIEELSRLSAPAPLEGAASASMSKAPSRAFPAHYACVIALAEGERCLAVSEGRVDGAIIEEARGSGGFGYDPYFFYPPFGKTFAEVTAREKFSVSHRGVAFRKLLEFLGSSDL